MNELYKLPDELRLLSLWQPWASLIPSGHKEIETRSWRTNYRGWVLIHAALRYSSEEKTVCLLRHFRETLLGMGYHNPDAIPTGCVLGAAYLADIVPTESIRESLSEKERAFGNYETGRWAWRFIDPIQFSRPIRFRGAQLLKPVTLAELKEAIHEPTSIPRT